MRIVDLRSDTVTLPTEEMLEAIKHADLGDDCYGEDPTVKRLEELAAEKMGKEDALLVTSGTQANLVSVMANTRRGDQIIVEEESHIYHNESNSMSTLAGIMLKTLKGNLGAMDPYDVKNAISPTTTLVCVENTHNRAGGTVIRPKQMKAMHEITKAQDIELYMDGARIFNAAVALGIDVGELTRHVDSTMFCLSKGLSAPIGSVVVGSSAFIEKARRMRNMVGGGMRQAGIIAAPGILAIENMVERLKDDHMNASVLAKGLNLIEGILIDLDTVQSNIVKFGVHNLAVDSTSFISRLNEHGVKAYSYGKTLVRLVTHRGIKREDVDYTLNVVEHVVEEIKGLTG